MAKKQRNPRTNKSRKKNTANKQTELIPRIREKDLESLQQNPAGEEYNP